MNDAHLPVSGTVVATTTAWGNAAPLDVALARIATHTTVTTVELAIGARPVADPAGVLDRYRDRFDYIGHHTLPLGAGVNLYPSPGNHATIAAVCQHFGLARYSAHPPYQRHCTLAQFYDWAAQYRDALGAIGVEFAVETMYVPRNPDEVAKSGGYHLARPDEVATFCDWARTRGWDRPLLVDASHLNIGVSGGDWTVAEVTELLASGTFAELHLSENDGRVDAHRPLTVGHRVAAWVEGLRVDLVVDEGRRRGLRVDRAHHGASRS